MLESYLGHIHTEDIHFVLSEVYLNNRRFHIYIILVLVGPNRVIEHVLEVCIHLELKLLRRGDNPRHYKVLTPVDSVTRSSFRITDRGITIVKS